MRELVVDARSLSDRGRLSPLAAATVFIGEMVGGEFYLTTASCFYAFSQHCVRVQGFLKAINKKRWLGWSVRVRCLRCWWC